MRRGIALVAGLRIVSAAFPRSSVRPIAVVPAPRSLARRLVGRRIAAVLRFGKRIALEVDPLGGLPRSDPDREWLVIEPRMTGQLLITAPPTRPHVRMILQFDARGAQPLTFWDQRGLGTIRLVDSRGLAAACGPPALGPDGLGITGHALQTALGRSRRAVKVALLDQRAVAGIGNIYAAEILHRCDVDPRAACRRLSADDWDAVATAARAVLAEAVACEGSTIGDATYKTADSRSGSFQHHHRVYGRTGQPCRACGTPVSRCVQAQRSTFFCPRCQWRPARRRRRL